MSGSDFIHLNDWTWFRIAKQCPLFVSIERTRALIDISVEEETGEINFIHPGFKNGSVRVEMDDYYNVTPGDIGVESIFVVPVRVLEMAGSSKRKK